MADPRTEAERLVAAALAAASIAARSTAGFATGSAECCVCPLCKAIAAMRDPDPDFAERLATGVGDLATGLAAVLRAFGSSVPGNQTDHRAGSAGREPGGDDVWHAATSASAPAAPKPDRKPAKKTVKKAVKKAVRPPANADEVGTGEAQ